MLFRSKRNALLDGLLKGYAISVTSRSRRSRSRDMCPCKLLTNDADIVGRIVRRDKLFLVMLLPWLGTEGVVGDRRANGPG